MLKVAGMVVTGLALLAESSLAQAEITVLDKNSNSNSLLAPLSLQVGGSIRPEWIFSGDDAQGYYKNGHDGGSRLRFSADYALGKQTSLLGYYEWGIDVAHLLDWSGHYDVDAPREHQRQMYIGIKNDTYGTLTYGHQFGLYYSVVGIKSDVWDNDGHAGGAGIGISGDFDGGNRPKRSLKYTKDFGPVVLYANYLFPEGNLDAGNGLYYRRLNGAGIGADYKVSKDFTLSAAYSYTAAKIGDFVDQQKQYGQQLMGTALTWQPNNWYLVGTANYYKNYVPRVGDRHLNHYFVGDGYGLEGFAGYTFKINKSILQSVRPYVALDSLQLHDNSHYHANRYYIGAQTQLDYGFVIYLERTFTRSSDNQPDQTWLTVMYNF